MKNVVIPLNAFNRTEVFEKGQEAFVELIATSGAYGIEIRRELFTESILPLEKVRKKIKEFDLFTVFSAPVELWNENGLINREMIRRTYQEAQNLGAKWMKVSLGHFHKEKSSCMELNLFLQELEGENGNVQLLVENDQTMHGGNVENLMAFFESAYLHQTPVKMTFDTGNWYYTGQDIQHALINLSKYVVYLHFKHVEKSGDDLVTLPLPNEEAAEWRDILKQFPTEMVKALEFPIEPVAETKKYIEMIQLAALEESREVKCNS
jgi:sugar phosphate isomerase/epimerase